MSKDSMNCSATLWRVQPGELKSGTWAYYSNLNPGRFGSGTVLNLSMGKSFCYSRVNSWMSNWHRWKALRDHDRFVTPKNLSVCRSVIVGKLSDDSMLLCGLGRHFRGVHVRHVSQKYYLFEMRLLGQRRSMDPRDPSTITPAAMT